MTPKSQVVEKFKKLYKTDKVKFDKIMDNMLEVKITSDYFQDMSLEQRYLHVLHSVKLHFPEIHKKYYIRVNGLYTNSEA